MYEATKLTDPDKADTFLYALRKAVILENSPALHRDELLRIACETDLPKDTFLAYLQNGKAEEAFCKDQAYSLSLGIHGLPAYRILCGGKSLLVRGMPDTGEFIRLIERVNCNA